MYKSKAFTLAEVLITLGIIGVVAAMTLPTLIQNYRKQIVEKKLYTAYNILQNMVRRSAVDNGDPYNWELDNLDEEIFEKYFAPYLKIIKKCKNTWNEDNVCDTSVSNINGDKNNAYNYKYILNNGLGIMFRPGQTLGTTSRRGTFIVDILSNGKKRVVGQNIFAFNLIVDKNRYFITGTTDFDSSLNFCNVGRQELIDGCKAGAIGSGFAFGIYCTAMIECNNFEIPDDYPVKF